MDKEKYLIWGVIFEIILNSSKYKIKDLFGEAQPYNLYINYFIKKVEHNEKQEQIIINDSLKNKATINLNKFVKIIIINNFLYLEIKALFKNIFCIF